MRSDHPAQGPAPYEHPQTHPTVRESDAIWLRRGQRLGELLLTSKASAYGWAAALGLLGASLVFLALVGLPEAGTGFTATAGGNVPP